MKLDSNAIGKTLSFDTVAGEKLKNLKLVSLPDASTLLELGIDVVAKHKEYLPYIANPKPVSHTAYLYAKFVDTNGNRQYYGIPWIKESSVIVNSNPGRIIRMPTATEEQIESLKTMMVKSGIEDFTIEAIS